MADIVGIRFKKAGKVYYFDPAGIELAVNDSVVVETAQGLEIGQVAMAPRPAPAGLILTPKAAQSEQMAGAPPTGSISVAEPPAVPETTEPADIAEPGQETSIPGPESTATVEPQTALKPVLRKATPEDLQRCQELELKEKDALEEAGKLIERLKLPMKLLSAEYSLDGQRLTIYFSSVDRVDFRELVRDLARRLKVRVEMRQTGPRDEARMVGGCGRCGRPLCCATFLTEFAPVAMKMAKEQGLPLNPMKISGVCGRLMCCLGYENENYRAMRGKLPRNGQWVSTPQGTAKVVGSNPLKETVLVELESRATAEFPLADVKKAEAPPEVRLPERPRREVQPGVQSRDESKQDNRPAGPRPQGQPSQNRGQERRESQPGGQNAQSRPDDRSRRDNQGGQNRQNRPQDGTPRDSRPGFQANVNRPQENRPTDNRQANEPVQSKPEQTPAVQNQSNVADSKQQTLPVENSRENQPVHEMPQDNKEQEVRAQGPTGESKPQDNTPKENQMDNEPPLNK